MAAALRSNLIGKRAERNRLTGDRLRGGLDELVFFGDGVIPERVPRE